jgi:hypothetical protein
MAPYRERERERREMRTKRHRMHRIAQQREPAVCAIPKLRHPVTHLVLVHERVVGDFQENRPERLGERRCGAVFQRRKRGYVFSGLRFPRRLDLEGPGACVVWVGNVLDCIVSILVSSGMHLRQGS